VYVREPTYKRGKAKKFEYQFKGPFEIEHKVSPLVYKVKMGDGTLAIIHINRLKRAHVLTKEALTVTKGGRGSKRGRPAGTVPSVNEEVGETESEGRGAFPNPQVVSAKYTESSETEDELGNLPQDRGNDSEWNPGSLHLRRALRKNIPTDEIASRLRSRLLDRSEREVDTASTDGSGLPAASAGESSSSWDRQAQVNTPFEAQSAVSHAYN
jgi:hypothetical protein